MTTLLNMGRGPPPEYDPHEHRRIPKATTNFETLIHVIKCSLGTGILAIPQAFTKAGLIPGVLGTIAVGIMLTHCLQLLIKMQYEVCKIKRVPQVTYGQALEASMLRGPSWMHNLAKPFAGSVDVFNITYQLGVCCVYIVFLAENMKKLVDPFKEMPLIVHMLIFALPLIALNLIPSLKALAPLSLVANLLTLVGIGILFYFMLTSKKEGVSTTLDYWGTPTQVPLFFGTMLFALTSVPVVVAVERTMKTPKAYTAFCGVLNSGMLFIVILYTCTGFLGYLYCVNLCSDSITLDMPPGPGAYAVQILMISAIFISYALHCYVPVDIIFRTYILPKLEKKDSSQKKIRTVEYILRISLATFTLVTAMMVPRLGLFISLFGALCLSALGMCFPTIMEICLFYPNKYGPAKIWLFKDIFLFLFGIVGLVAGTYTALSGIITSFM